MRIPLAFAGIVIQQVILIRDIGENVLEMQSIRDQLMEQIVITDIPRFSRLNSSTSPEPDKYCEVPVALPNKTGFKMAWVSPEDFEVVVSCSTRWRLCSSGYPISVKRVGGKFVTTYMHKLIYGGTAKHINGNRLDNRRGNLIGSKKKPPTPKTSSHEGV